MRASITASGNAHPTWRALYRNPFVNLISPVQGQPVRSTGQRLAFDATGHGALPVLRDRWGDPELLAAMRGETVETAPEIDVDGDIAEHA